MWMRPKGEEGRPGTQTNVRQSEHITWLCARDRGTGHCWTTGRTCYVKWRRKRRGKIKNGWRGAMGRRRAGHLLRLSKRRRQRQRPWKISFADKIYYTYLNGALSAWQSCLRDEQDHGTGHCWTTGRKSQMKRSTMGQKWRTMGQRRRL